MTANLFGDSTVSYTLGVAFGDDALAASPTFTDLSAYVRGIPTMSRGRQNELDQARVGALAVVLDNTDQRFDPDNSSSPYTGNIKPMVPVRLQMTHSSVTYDVWYGYADAWELSYKIPNDATCTLTASGGLKLLNLLKLLSLWEYEIISDTPTHWFRLSEKSGNAALDEQTDLQGSYVGSPSHSGSLINGTSDGSVGLDGSNDYVDFGTTPSFIGTGTFSVEFWIASTDAAAGGAQAIYFQRGGGDETALGQLTIEKQAGAVSGYALRFWTGTDDGDVVISSDLAADGVAHHIVCLRNTTPDLLIFVDGALDTSSGSHTATTLRAHTCSLGADLSDDDQFLSATIDDLTMYAGVALTSSQISDHYDASNNPRGGDDSDNRITWVLDTIGWPAGLRSLSDSVTIVSDFLEGGSSALKHVRAMATADNGFTFIARDGSVVFEERDHRSVNNDVSQATYGLTASGELSYSAMRQRQDDSQVWNTIRAGAKGGREHVAEDSTSQSDFGERGLSRTGLLLNSDTVGASYAAYLLGRYKDPATRVPRLLLWPLKDHTNLVPDVLGFEIGTRITVKRDPPGSGDVYNADFHIEGITHRITPGEWQVVWDLSPANVQAFAVTNSDTNGILDEDHVRTTY